MIGLHNKGTLKTSNKNIINNHTNNEHWKYTSIKHFKSCNLNFVPIKNKLKKVIPKSNEIILYNGNVYCYGNEIKKNNLHVCNIKHAIRKNINNINKYFNKILPYDNDLYLNYNTSLFDRGMYLFFPPNTKLNKHINIKHIIDEGENSSFLNCRNYIHSSENVVASIVNYEELDINQCINTACEIYIEKESKIEIINYSKKPNTKQLLNCAALIKSNSLLQFHAIDMNSKLVKNNYYIKLGGINSQCLFNGCNIANNDDHIDNYIEIRHLDKYTFSDLNYKIITNKTSKSILFAKSIIEKNSSNSEAYQNNNNIMLSNKSTINSNPQLEIYNDDVKCSHASTTGQIDTEAIYYMRTRGINKKNAKKLILGSFLNSVFENIKSITIQNYFKKKVTKYLNELEN